MRKSILISRHFYAYIYLVITNLLVYLFVHVIRRLKDHSHCRIEALQAAEAPSERY